MSSFFELQFVSGTVADNCGGSAVAAGVAQCLVPQWIHILRQYKGDFWKNFQVFYVSG